MQCHFLTHALSIFRRRRPYGKRHVLRRDTRVGQEQGHLPESPGGHGRQPARRRHSGRVHRLLPVVHVPAGMHRHRRRARHGMPGQRHGPVQGKLHPRRGAGIELPASLRHRLRRERRLRKAKRRTEPLQQLSRQLRRRRVAAETGRKVPLQRAPGSGRGIQTLTGGEAYPSPRSSAPKTPKCEKKRRIEAEIIQVVLFLEKEGIFT